MSTHKKINKIAVPGQYNASIVCFKLLESTINIITQLCTLCHNSDMCCFVRVDMEEVPQSVLQNLSCGPGLMYSRIGAHCNFPGSQIYEKAHQLNTLLDQISQLQESNEAKGWLTQYNIHNVFSNPVYVSFCSCTAKN